MGNCCGIPSKGDGNFAGEGRTLGASPATNPPSNPPRAKIPATVASASTGDESSKAADAARNAAVDRVERTNSSPKGKLGQTLAEQKKQTRTNVLEDAAREERVARETDQNTKNLQYS